VQVLQGKAAARAGQGGPNGMRHFEQSLAALAGAPLTATAKLDLLAIVDDYVIGHVVRAAELTQRGRTETEAADTRAESVRQFTDAQLATGSFPHLAALARDPAVASLGDPGHLDDRFERGLRLLIDGIAAETEQAGYPQQR